MDIRIARLKGKDGKPGPVKIQLNDKDEKIAVLHAKKNLKDVHNYQRVYMRSSMTHADRLIYLNFQTILQQLPSGDILE